MDYDKSRRHNSSNPKKRTHSNSDDGKRKRLNSRNDDGSMSSQPIETIYRILCPVKKIGSVLGRGGDIVKALREETKAKIRVADSIPGADERVIIIFNYQNQSEQADEAAENISNDGLENSKPHCFAQDALLKIHDRIAANEDLHDGGVHERSETVDDVTARILVPGNQVGCLLGKGGSIIQQLRNDTGAGIRVLPSENLPWCALKSDELVQAAGQMHGREDYRRLTGVTGYSSSSVELRIPNGSLESVIGIGGVNLAEIRQISGARVKLLGSHPGSSESIVEIQGMPDQVKAAQSLVQGFIGANSQGTQPSQSSRTVRIQAGTKFY